MKRTLERRCPFCKGLFSPNRRNADKQVYCCKPECRKASKAASQRRWTSKNPDYFKDEVHVKRVREWRKAHPIRARGKTPDSVLQDHLIGFPAPDQHVTVPAPLQPRAEPLVLQDFVLMQHPVLIGLIAHMTGAVLQDDIAKAARHLEQLGKDVIGSNSISGGYHDPKDPDLSRPHPQHPRPVQLVGSPPGT